MKKIVALGSSTLLATGFVAATSQADATPLTDCGTYSDDVSVELINSSICSVVFDRAGSYEFTAPQGVDKLQALVVGAGAVGYFVEGYGFAGGGGGVVFIEDLAPETTHEVTVGAGGTRVLNSFAVPDLGNGGSSSVGNVSALGGFASDSTENPRAEGSNSGKSGSGNSGFASFEFQGNYLNVWGGGSKSPASDISGGLEGSGFRPSDTELTSGSSLFPVISGEPVLGQGGKMSGVGVAVGTPPSQFIGWGGDADLNQNPKNGSDGGVIFRFTFKELAKTGAESAVKTNWLISALLIGLGSIGLGYSLRRKKSEI